MSELRSGPGIRQALTTAAAFKRGDVSVLDALHESHGDIFYLPFPVNAYVVSSPQLIDEILTTRHHHYRKSDNYRHMERVMGAGLVTSDGAEWVAQRTHLRQAFNRGAIAAHGPRIGRLAQRFVERWDATLGDGRSFDVAGDLSALSANLTNDALFGSACVDQCPGLHRFIEDAAQAVVERVYSPITAPDWLPNRTNRRTLHATRQLHRALDTLLARRAATRGEEPTILDALLRAAGQTGRGHHELGEPLRHQVLTLLLAGQDTLAAALQWSLHCLAMHPETQERVSREVRTHAPHAPLDHHALQHLPQTRAALLECLRLFPPIPVIARTPRVPQTLGGHRVPTGSVVLCSIRALHRHPAVWSTPDAFLPDRFEHLGQEQSRAFYPFAAGPRRCIGAQLAMHQLVIAVATLMRRFRLSNAAGFTPQPHTTITMKPNNGMRIHMTRRADSPASQPRRPARRPAWDPHHERLPRESLQAGKYRVRFATTAQDLEAAQRLRFEIFNLELGQGLEGSFASGKDRDGFDDTSDHLLVEAQHRGAQDQVVGTYRLRTRAMAGQAGFYSGGDFELSVMPSHIAQQGVELGRACIHPAHRNGRVLLLLWKGLARYVAYHELRYVFGCCSLPTVDEAVGWTLHRQLHAAGHVHPNLEVPAVLARRCAEPEGAAEHAGGPVGDASLPPLFRSYLRLGAKVCSPPAIDHEFKALSFFVVLDTHQLRESDRRTLFRKQSWQRTARAQASIMQVDGPL